MEPIVNMDLIVVLIVYSVGRQIHDMTVTNAALGDDVVSEFLDFGATSPEHRDLHAAFVIEVHVQSRLR